MQSIQELVDLSGKAAIVTGGAKGIGQGICLRLAEAGAKVLVADMDEATAQQTAEEIAGRGWSAEAIKTDVSEEEQVEAMVAGLQ